MTQPALSARPYPAPDGWTKMSGTDVGELHYEYYPATPVGEAPAAAVEGAVAMEA